jgi:futalosine hydrolase
VDERDEEYIMVHSSFGGTSESTMNILLTAATSMEMQAYINAFKGIQKGDRGGPGEKTRRRNRGKTRGKALRKEQAAISHLVTGIGPVETTLALAGTLQKNNTIDCVMNFGIAGAYLENGTSMHARLLDLCLAHQEVLGDLGIQLEDRVEKFSNDLPVQDSFVLDPVLLSAASRILENKGILYKVGNFVTVNCATGTLDRGNQLGRQYCGLCENMEGAAVARVCAEFSLPCLEVRCISNMVEDRNRENWQIQEACAKAGRAVAALADGLLSG